MNGQDEYMQAYRLTFDCYSLQAASRQNRVNVALFVNGGLLALAGSFRESEVILSAVGLLGLLSNVAFLLTLSRLRAYLDLLDAELRALEHYLPHVTHRLLEKRLTRDPQRVTNDDLLEHLSLSREELAEGDDVVLPRDLVNTWLPLWNLPLVGRMGGVRGLDQSFFLLLAVMWPLFAALTAVLG